MTLTSSMKPIRTQPASPRDTLEDWRRRRLIAAGLDAPLAAWVADSGIDLHELLVLVDRGCPPDLAARILAPIDAPAP
jgi:hypothetical protein